MTSIRNKLIVYVGLPTLIVYVAMLGGALVFLRARSLSELEQTMTRLAANYAGRFDGYLREAAAVADTSAIAYGNDVHCPIENIYSQLRAGVQQRTFIYGAAAAFEPGLVRPADELFSPYVHRDSQSIAEMNITREVYDWYSDPKWTWYQEPKSLNKPVWSPPYFDEGAGNVLMTTYSAPFYDHGKFAGIATVDIDLVSLRENIGVNVAEGAEFMILAHDGSFIYDRHSERILHQRLDEIAQTTKNRELQRILPALLGGSAGVADVPGWDSPEKQWLFYSPITSTGWTFVAFVPENVALADVRSRMITATAALTITLLMIVALIALVSRKITAPLSGLTEKVREIAEGNINARVENINSKDEVGVLAVAFNTMTSRLQEHIERLAQEEAARKKVEYDLSIARDIQRSLLPELVPSLNGYDLAGWSQPADQTGGDYYDWQELPGGRLAITLADVTGHGIGPALVTAVCRAYARASFPDEADVSKVLSRINRLLCEDLRSGRFVTFVGVIIDSANHRLRMLSAGHGPLFYYEAATDQVHQFDAHDIPMGLSPDIELCPPSEFRPAPGDALILVTDGFFEWANSKGEQFGTARLAEAIRACHSLPAARMIDYLVSVVESFTSPTRQPDDLTAVVLKRVAT